MPQITPKRGEVWRTVKYLSDNFYDKTEIVNIIDVIEIGDIIFVRYRERESIWTHIILTLITGGIWLLMYYGESNLNEKRIEEFLKISTKICHK